MYVAAHNGAFVYGGAERATLTLLAGLQARGHRVHLFCNSPVVSGPAEEFGIAAEMALIGGDAMLPHALRFAAKLRRHRPDVLLVGTFKKMLLAAGAARLAGVPRVVARIGLETDTPRWRKYNFAIDHWVDCVVLKTEDMRRRYLDAGIDAAKLAIVPGGIALRPRLHPPGEVRRSLGLPPGARVVGATARLDVQKRFDRLLRAFVRLPADVHCVLAGEGPERAALEALAAELGVRERVHFLGHREDVGDVLDALDLYLITSDREGMSNSMMEALAAGVPVVSTRVSGAPDALDPLDDGSAPGVVVGFDAGEVADAAGRILESPPLRAEMRAAALRRARESFSLERMLDGWEAVLSGSGVARGG
ncbi:MAG: glycosyltransferase [Gemmatimonadetes bacterium]|nr:glycosyltransferase [Gemmatimonadota bacterium]